MISRKPMNKPQQKPKIIPLVEPIPYARYIKVCLYLLATAFLLMMLSGCSSKALTIPPMPAPPANLASKCPKLTPPPKPLLDPERLLWEKDIIEKRNQCALKHDLTIEAWQDAIKATGK